MAWWVVVSLGDWEEDGREEIRGKEKEWESEAEEKRKKHLRGLGEEMDGETGWADGCKAVQEKRQKGMLR